MKQSELDRILDADPYHIQRKSPRDDEIRLFLREVGFHCPLCGNELQSRKQKKPDQKQFEIAHIYPNRPTIQQYVTLRGLERLGNTSEDFENKIALCLSCHKQQDFHTSKDDYEALLSIKKNCLMVSALHDVTEGVQIEKELKEIVARICKTPTSELVALNMNPVRIADKLDEGDALISLRIIGYITQYYTFVRDLFREQDGVNGFVFAALCCEMRALFLRMDAISKDKEEIFRQLADLIKRKTISSSQTACEIVVAFFVQNCEVFNEITR